MGNEIEGYFGIVADTRSDVEKAHDYQHSQVYGMGIVEWKKKDIKDLKTYTKRYQDGSLSCGGQSGAKAVETLIGKVISAHPPYRSRANYPSGGMWMADIGDTFKKVGTDLEADDQSQNEGENFLNRDITVPTPYKIKGYLQTKNIDEIAQAIQTWGHCILMFHANGSEWYEKPVFNGKEINFGHYICAVDFFLDENGVKCLWIEDSALPYTTINKDGHRIITEDYFNQRCNGGIYFLGINPLEVSYTFTKVLKVGSIGYDVKRLQMKLNSLGYMLKEDGNYGIMTGKAVQDFQTKHNLIADKIVGFNTNKVLNTI